MPVAQNRLLVAAFGGTFGAAIVALVETRGALAGGSVEAPLTLFMADFGLLSVPAALGGFVVGMVHWALEPGLPSTPARVVAQWRQQPLPERSWLAAFLPLVTIGASVAAVTVANLARALLSEGAPIAAGARLALASLAVIAVCASAVLALVPYLRRAVVAYGARWPWLVDPACTGGASFALMVACFALGVRAGDVGGDGAWPLGIFGVMRRAELDLRPVAEALLIGASAYLAGLSLASRRASWRSLAVGWGIVVVMAAVATVRASALLTASGSLTRTMQQSAPLGRLALALLGRVTDRDHDGASPYFGGGDCDDHDPARGPTARDVPGNGVDEDCSGADTPARAAPPQRPVVVVPVAAPEVPIGLNLVLITIDTLRPDVGFMGYEKPTTPNLDALAAKSVVFDRAYAMASYTGKSVGPLLIGQYPSETQRDGGHFNRYSAGNTFFAERLKAAGVRTFGGASHWYFGAWSGLSQGIDEWDLSAKPKDGQGDSDTSVTSAELSNVALRMLAKPVNTSGRFFMWLHYFDPHEQYVEHAEAPDFAGPGARVQAVIRGRYDGEIWFTDKHLGRVLDFIGRQPWADRTAIVVTSDHGEAFGEHQMSWHGGELWECLVRVPLLVYVPGAVAHHVPEKRSHIDLVPTLLELMRVPAKDGRLSGRSMLADLLGRPPYEERDVFIDMPAGPYTQMRKAVVSGPSPGTKLIYSGGKNYQLYDLATDPDEARDLSANPSALAPMIDALDRARGGLNEFEVKPDAP